jgi:hypothetical protein
MILSLTWRLDCMELSVSVRRFITGISKATDIKNRENTITIFLFLKNRMNKARMRPRNVPLDWVIRVTIVVTKREISKI